MRQKQTKKPGHDGHRYLIVVPESGEMYLEILDTNVRAACRKLLGTNQVSSVPCGMDKRFTVLFSTECTPATDRYNRTASRLAQERLLGPCVVVRGERGSDLHGLSRYGAMKAIAQIEEMAGGDEYV